MPEKKDPLPFVAYAKAFIRKNFKPIRDDDITTSFEWLSDASYSGSRKRQLMELMSTVRNHDSKFVQNKSFIKFEGYMEPKNARGINSYHDALKLLLGPVCKAIDKSTFSTKWFVKGTDPRDWPKLLSKLFGSSRVRETDFSSFEAHHADEFAEVVAYWIKHMLREVTIPRVYKRMILRCMLGVNVCKFHNITVRLKQRLMSGALWTSSSNGVLNLLFMSYMSLRAIHPDEDGEGLVNHLDDFVGLVEGDDGICLDVGDVDETVDRLGLKLKMEVSENFGHAKFCGNICDIDELKIVTDPLKVMANFFVLDKKYSGMRENAHEGLLRAKAFSYKYAFNDCPVVGELCQYVLDMTRGKDCRKYLEAEHLGFRSDLARKSHGEKSWKLKPEVPFSCRLLVEERFGVAVSKQLEWEAEFRLAAMERRNPRLLFGCIDRNMEVINMFHIKEDREDPVYMHNISPMILDIANRKRSVIEVEKGLLTKTIPRQFKREVTRNDLYGRDLEYGVQMDVG